MAAGGLRLAFVYLMKYNDLGLKKTLQATLYFEFIFKMFFFFHFHQSLEITRNMKLLLEEVSMENLKIAL